MQPPLLVDSYLAKYFSGDKTDTEKIRHDKALEKYQKDYAEYQENRQKLIDWKVQKRRCINTKLQKIFRIQMKL